MTSTTYDDNDDDNDDDNEGNYDYDDDDLIEGGGLVKGVASNGKKDVEKGVVSTPSSNYDHHHCDYDENTLCTKNKKNHFKKIVKDTNAHRVRRTK